MEYDIDQRLKNMHSSVVALGAIGFTTKSYYDEIKGLQSLFAYNKLEPDDLGEDRYHKAQDKVNKLSVFMAKSCIEIERRKLRRSFRSSSKERHKKNIEALEKIINAPVHRPPKMSCLERVFEFYKNLRAGKKGMRYESITFDAEQEASIQHQQITLDYAVSKDAKQFYEKLLVSIDAMCKQPVPGPISMLIDNQQCDENQWTHNLSMIRESIHGFQKDVFAEPKDGQRFSQANQAYLVIQDGKICYLSDIQKADRCTDSRLCSGLGDNRIGNAQRFCVPQRPDNGSIQQQQSQTHSPNANRAIFGGLHLNNGALIVDVSMLECRTGSSSCCTPFYEINAQEGSGTIKAMIYDINEDAIISKVWAGENLHESTISQLQSMLDSSGGVYGLFEKICNGQINHDGHVNGDLKLDNICFNAIDGSITIIDNDYKADETPRDCWTGAMFSTLSHTEWYDGFLCVPGTLLGVQQQNSQEWKSFSIMDAWLKRSSNLRNTSQTPFYQVRYMQELVSRLKNMTNGDDVNTPKCDKNALGEGLIIEFFRFGQTETLHDAFSLCTVAIQLVDRVDPTSNGPGHYLKKRAIDYQNKILAKLSEVVKDAQESYPHVQLTQLQKVFILEEMCFAKGKKKREKTQIAFDDIRAEFEDDLDKKIADINKKLPPSDHLTRESVNDYKDYLIYVLPKLEAFNELFSLEKVKEELLSPPNDPCIELPNDLKSLTRESLEHMRGTTSSDGDLRSDSEGHTSRESQGSRSSISSFKTANEGVVENEDVLEALSKKADFFAEEDSTSTDDEDDEDDKTGKRLSSH